MAAKVARVAAPKVAAMATSANAPGASPRPGNRLAAAWPNRLPTPPAINRMGASVPPDVPDARAIHHAISLAAARVAATPIVTRSVRMSVMPS